MIILNLTCDRYSATHLYQRLVTGLLVFLMSVNVLAQGMPGGMGGGGVPSGMRPPQASKMPTAEDFIVPDPLYIWHAKLIGVRGSLGLISFQAIAFDDFLRSLDQVVRFNERQVWRVLGRSKAVVSAVANPQRDLNMATEDAQDAAKTWEDLSAQYAKLTAVLAVNQQQLILQSYGDSLAASLLQKKLPSGGLPPGR